MLGCGDDPDAPGPDGVLEVAGTTIAFGPEPPVVDPNGPSPSWECQIDDGSLVAVGSFQEAPERAYDITIRSFEAGPNGEELTIRVDRGSVPWAWVNPADRFADAVADVSLDGSTLVATGQLFVNDPPVQGLGPVNVLPPGSELEPFRLAVRCDG